MSIEYDGTTRWLEIPDDHLVMPERRDAVADPKPAEGSFGNLVLELAGSRRLLIVVNDGYRPTPTGPVLEHLEDLTHQVAEIRTVVATGAHPAPDESWLRSTLGRFWAPDRVFVHDALAPTRFFGRLSDGTDLRLNPLLDWADAILLIGSVEPHFFAGFTGGAKQILPGLASRETIEANHRRAVDPACRPLRVEDNPVARAIREAGELFADRLWSVQAISGSDGWVFFCGREPRTSDQARGCCARWTELHWPQPVDALVAVIEAPLDRNLYQLQKGFENHRQVVRNGGSMLLISACRDGVGNAFFEPLARRYPHWDALPAWEDQPYSLGLHKLYRTADARKTIHLDVYSTQSPQTLRRFYLEPAPEPDRWIRQHCRSRAALGVVQHATSQVSVLEDRVPRAHQ